MEGANELILEKRVGINVRQIEHLTHGEGRVGEVLERFVGLVPLYRGAMKEVCTKLEVLDEEFQILHAHNPIHHIECRMKSGESIIEKMIRKKVPFTLEALREQIQDIAGLRVVCNYTDDIYSLSKVLVAQSDITLLRQSDYIKSPKPSGYRSLHLVVTVPVFLVGRCELVPVEVQLRTIGMDMWASLEHELRYKATDPMAAEDALALKTCADDLIDVDRRMGEIYKRRQSVRDVM